MPQFLIGSSLVFSCSTNCHFNFATETRLIPSVSSIDVCNFAYVACPYSPQSMVLYRLWSLHSYPKVELLLREALEAQLSALLQWLLLMDADAMWLSQMMLLLRRYEYEHITHFIWSHATTFRVFCRYTVCVATCASKVDNYYMKTEWPVEILLDKNFWKFYSLINLLVIGL